MNKNACHTNSRNDYLDLYFHEIPSREEALRPSRIGPSRASIERGIYIQAVEEYESIRARANAPLHVLLTTCRNDVMRVYRKGRERTTGP